MNIWINSARHSQIAGFAAPDIVMLCFVQESNSVSQCVAAIPAGLQGFSLKSETMVS